MGTPPQVRRFRTNPVELAIFAVVTLVFVNSLYNLVYDRQGFHPTTLTPTAANPLADSGDAAGRAPASVSTSAFQTIDFQCTPDQQTHAKSAKVRFVGTLCDSGGDGDSKAPTKTTLTNLANHFAATVFANPGTERFSTDYVPLEPGANNFRVEFTYEGGKSVTREIAVTRD